MLCHEIMETTVSKNLKPHHFDTFDGMLYPKEPLTIINTRIDIIGVVKLLKWTLISSTLKTIVQDL